MGGGERLTMGIGEGERVSWGEGPEGYLSGGGGLTRVILFIHFVS